MAGGAWSADRRLLSLERAGMNRRNRPSRPSPAAQRLPDSRPRATSNGWDTAPISNEAGRAASRSQEV